jgi:sulfatase-modifying factor enzyme 1/DinB family protein
VSNLVTPSVQPHGARHVDRFLSVRAHTEQLAAPLSAEDQTVQSMPDASPTKWHLAHTTWFFETFLLRPRARGYQAFDPAYEYLFNSYYEAVGPRHPRPQRGIITRPGVEEILAYRRHVTRAMVELIEQDRGDGYPLLELGLNHEQQHQELILMDAKHMLSLNPLKPAYAPASASPISRDTYVSWIDFEGGLVGIGHAGNGFAFDNEGPRHRVWLDPFALATRPVNCGEYLAFIEDGGYRRPEFWLSAGWDCVNQRGWQAPLYWEEGGDGWQAFTLAAYAKWAGKRLPREQEWETGADQLKQVGEVWEWTASPYIAYPGYREPAGAIGEYNGKFMANQTVLRGGCAATPSDHIRTTYRNFFPPDARWMFGGIRLAEDLR